MKIRQGFVSNSSSSSFLLAFTEIVNKDAFDRWVKDLKFDINTLKDDEYWYRSCGGCWVVTGKQILEKYIKRIDSFQSDIKIDSSKINLEKYYFIVNEINDEGDGAFTSGEPDDYEPNYDIDVTFLPIYQQEIYSAVYDKKDIFDSVNTNCYYAAARNG